MLARRGSAIKLLLIAIGLSGCTPLVHEIVHKPANNKQLPKYPKDHEDPTVSIISIDASRRVLMSQIHPQPYQQTVVTGGDSPGGNVSLPQQGNVRGAFMPNGDLRELRARRFTCSEPPPDVAMNSFAQDVASFANKVGTKAELGSALQQIAQVISARSPHVEMWRTTSWTYCNLLMNGADDRAKEYLTASQLAFAVPVHQATATPTPTSFSESLIFLAKNMREMGERLEAANLEIAKLKCEKVEEAKKTDDANCKLVKASEAIKPAA